MAGDGGHLDRAFARNYSVPTLDAAAGHSGREAELPVRPRNYIDFVDNIHSRAQKDREADHTAEQPVLDRDSGSNLRSEHPDIRLDQSIAFIVEKGMAIEFMHWLRKQ